MDTPIAPEGFCVLLAPADCGGCSFNAVEYPATDGFVMVPQEAVNTLLGYGFVVAE